MAPTMTLPPSQSALLDELRDGFRQGHHITGRLLDWTVSLDPDTSAATAIRFRSASLNLDAQLADRMPTVVHETGAAMPQPKAHHDRTD